MEKNDIFALIDELEEEIDLSPVKGFNKNKVIDEKIVKEIIADIKASAHEEFDFSHRVMAERGQIIAAAQAQGEEIIRQARMKADDMVKQEAISKAASERAAKIVESSKLKSAEIRRSADMYAEDVFNELEAFYRDSIDIINENKNRLHAKKGASAADQPGGTAVTISQQMSAAAPACTRRESAKPRR